jgi:transposase
LFETRRISSRAAVGQPPPRCSRGAGLVIRAADAKLFFLPRYLSDLKPFEQVFAKLKTLLRKKPTRAQSKPPGAASATFSTASPHGNGPITSPMPDIASA